MLQKGFISLLMLLALALPAASTRAAQRAATTTRAAAGPSSPRQVRAKLAALPLGFEPNRGQSARPVRFLAHGAGYTAFLTDRGLTIALTSSRTAAGLRLLPSGARAAGPVATQRLTGTVSYFLGKEHAGWITDVPRFGRVSYHNLYAGIDLAVYGRQTSLEYDWIVRPGASPATIALAVGGARVERDRTGSFLMRTATGTVRQSRPTIYQIVDGRRRQVRGETSLTGNTIRFRVGSYDRHRPLIIDPVLTYSSYLGGSSNDSANGIAVDGSGDAYVTGYTASTNFPVTANAYQTMIHGGTDAFLTEISPDGSTLLYSSYLGGGNNDYGQSVAVDGTTDGYAYLTGYTYSANFPVTPSALQYTAPAGEQYHAFVTVINTLAVRTAQLVYSTYLGGTASTTTGTIGYGIAADSGHNAYVTGLTYATTLPTLHPFQGTQSAGGVYPNAFLIRLAISQYGAHSLVYGTYFGASPTTGVGAYGVATDGKGMAAITGFVQGAGLPTRNAYQSAYGGGADDAFIADFDTNATGGNNSLVFSSYLGGSGDDVGRGIATDGAGNYYLTGSSSSPNFPQSDTANPIVPPGNRGGPSDAFATKLHYTPGSTLTLAYSVLIGGSGQDVGTGIGFDASGNTYLAGYTASVNFPVVDPLPGQAVYQGGAYDAFVTEINSQATGLVYSTYLGGSGDDRALALAVLGSDVYVAGITTSPNFPTTGTLSPAANAGTICPGQATPCADGFVARISQTQPSVLAGTVKGSAVCTISNHTTGTPVCSVSPAISCGSTPTCQLAISVDAACSNPPVTYSCGRTGGRLGTRSFYAQWLSGSNGGTSVEGGTTTLNGVGFYGPAHGPGANAAFQLTGQDSDTGTPSADSDSVSVKISPINGATFPTTTASWTCTPPSPPCSLEITVD